MRFTATFWCRCGKNKADIEGRDPRADCPRGWWAVHVDMPSGQFIGAREFTCSLPCAMEFILALLSDPTSLGPVRLSLYRGEGSR